jgi:hypothetical protein
MARKKWDIQNEYIAKSFKMYKSLADEFKKVCEKKGVAQSVAITELISNFIEDANNENTKQIVLETER